jgi:hypothetical protein
MLESQWLLLPVLIHVAVVFALLFRLASLRLSAARRREVRLGEVALDSSRWPDRARKLGNSFDNQFQLPVLWYVLTAFWLGTGSADRIALGLSWVFLGTRMVHLAVHTGNNDVRRRFYAFAAGAVILLAAWVWFALRMYVLG